VLRQLFISSRPLSWVNTAFPFAAAYFIVAREIDLTLLVGTLFFLIPYNLLMYGINDVFDYESDLRNPRKGGVEGGLLRPEWHRATTITALVTCIPFLAYLLIVGNQWSQFWLLLTVFTVLAYSVAGLRFKEKPILDSFTSSSHFVGPMLVGLTQAEAQFSVELVLISAAFFLWGAASHAFGAVQDIAPDRTARIGSIATRFGAAWTSRLALVLYLVAAALLLLLPWPATLAALAVVPYLFVVSRYLNLSDSDCEQANRGWRYFLALNFFAGTVVSLLIAWVLRFG
jgi:4-hydroxybenzoate polyprenyltransferase